MGFNKIVHLALIFCTVVFSQKVIALTVPSECGSGEYLRKVNVSTALQLKSALAQARSGDYISIRSGIYSDSFVVDGVIATSKLRVHICGQSGAILKAKTTNSGYGLHIKNSNFIRVSQLEITGYLKGVMLDKSNYNILQRLHVHHIATEGVHFRTHSSSNSLLMSEISYTGLVEDWYGEGVYIGSAKSNWCKYTSCQPDRSNNNKVLGNTIHHTAAESIDIKEGTTGGLIQKNIFEGSLMTGEYADSFIDVKGNNFVIDGNKGTVGFNGSTPAQKNAFQVHVNATGFGNGNSFLANSVAGKLSGYIVDIQRTSTGNTVRCDNMAPQGALGVSNITCY